MFLEMEFFWGSPWCIIDLLTKIAIPKQKIYFWFQISKFGGQNCTFSSLAAHCSLAGQYLYTKPVSNRVLDMRVPKVFLLSSKIRNLILLATSISRTGRAQQKNNVNEVPMWFTDMWVPEILLPLKIITMFGPKRPFLPKNMLS